MDYRLKKKKDGDVPSFTFAVNSSVAACKKEQKQPSKKRDVSGFHESCGFSSRNVIVEEKFENMDQKTPPQSRSGVDYTIGDHDTVVETGKNRKDYRQKRVQERADPFLVQAKIGYIRHVTTTSSRVSARIHPSHR